ncbi:5-deoxy-glucuronate isomerase [Candidatus Poribacteria bacterium]|nr:5-deoxy-glucuronate isomerase [Candidatus Poribacteria bacterium]
MQIHVVSPQGIIKKHYTPAEGYTEVVTPGEIGITKLHFGILNLTPEATFFDHSDDTEVALIALGGHCTLLVGHNGNKAYGVLGERPDVFHGEACVAHIPHHTTYEVLAGEAGIEVAVCKVLSYAESAAIILEAGETVDESETHLRIWETDLSGEVDVETWDANVMLSGEEAICLHRFRDADGVATFDITRTVETVRVRLYHNDILAVPEQDTIAALDSEGVGYQLWVQPDF